MGTFTRCYESKRTTRNAIMQRLRQTGPCIDSGMAMQRLTMSAERKSKEGTLTRWKYYSTDAVLEGRGSRGTHF